MHSDSYNVNVACFCSKNLIKSLEEVKSFFTFKLTPVNVGSENSINSKYNVLIVEFDTKEKISLNTINIPKIFIQGKNQKRISKNPFELTLKLPLNVVKFNQAVVDLCKKHEFNKNSLVKINGYILDKNERVLRKGKKNLKITEKEIYFIDVLYSSDKPLSKDHILKNIWAYSPDTDTHTVETHIYRLRQKIKDNFGDDNFIKNTEEGYFI